jgi:hypothetical protein
MFVKDFFGMVIADGSRRPWMDLGLRGSVPVQAGQDQHLIARFSNGRWHRVAPGALLGGIQCAQARRRSGLLVDQSQWILLRMRDLD